MPTFFNKNKDHSKEEVDADQQIRSNKVNSSPNEFFSQKTKSNMLLCLILGINMARTIYPIYHAVTEHEPFHKKFPPEQAPPLIDFHPWLWLSSLFANYFMITSIFENLKDQLNGKEKNADDFNFFIDLGMAMHFARIPLLLDTGYAQVSIKSEILDNLITLATVAVTKAQLSTPHSEQAECRVEELSDDDDKDIEPQKPGL